MTSDVLGYQGVQPARLGQDGDLHFHLADGRLLCGLGLRDLKVFGSVSEYPLHWYVGSLLDCVGTSKGVNTDTDAHGHLPHKPSNAPSACPVSTLRLRSQGPCVRTNSRRKRVRVSVLRRTTRCFLNMGSPLVVWLGPSAPRRPESIGIGGSVRRTDPPSRLEVRVRVHTVTLQLWATLTYHAVK